jgi:hypothetical protein
VSSTLSTTFGNEPVWNSIIEATTLGWVAALGHSRPGSSQQEVWPYPLCPVRRHSRSLQLPEMCSVLGRIDIAVANEPLTMRPFGSQTGSGGRRRVLEGGNLVVQSGEKLGPSLDRPIGSPEIVFAGMNRFI